MRSNRDAPDTMVMAAAPYPNCDSENTWAVKSSTSVSDSRQASAGRPAFIVQQVDKNSSADQPRSLATLGKKHPD